MSSLSTLKLVGLVDGPPDVLSLERRGSRRNVFRGRVTGICSTPASPNSRNHICSLDLRNISETGLAALSTEPIDANASIAVFLPPHGPDGGLDLYGRVVRCRPGKHGHEVGIEFDQSSDQRRAC